MSYRKGSQEVVYVSRGEDSSAKWLFFGAVLGAGLALLYAPRSGEETRRSLQRSLWKLRAMTEEKLDEFTQQFGNTAERVRDMGASLQDSDEDLVDDDDDMSDVRAASPRQELERRLAETRARRRGQADFDEPLA